MRLPILAALLALLAAPLAADPAQAGDRGHGGCGGGCGGGGHHPPQPPHGGGHDGGGHHGGWNTNINVNVNAAARASAYAGARGYSTGTFERRGGYGGTLIGAGGGFSYGDYGYGYGYPGPIYAETRGPAPVSRPFGYRVWGFGRDYRTTDACYRGCPPPPPPPPPPCSPCGGYGYGGSEHGGYSEHGSFRGGSSYSSYESTSEATYIQPESVYVYPDAGGAQPYIPDYVPAHNDQGYYGDLPPEGALPYRQEPGERG
jgi:hypothetical protein